MRKEELEKYINEEVEVTIKVSGLREFTHKGKLVKEDRIFTAVQRSVYGAKPNDDWFALILENKKSYSFHFETVKKIKRLKYKL